MATRLLILALLMIAGTARGADTYFCACDAGAEAGCTPGTSDSAAGTIGDPKLTWAGALAAYDAAACGDTVNICMGGAWAVSGTSPLTNATDCTANRRIFRTYNPGGFTQRPRAVMASGGGALMSFGAFGGIAFVGGQVSGGIDLVQATPDAAGGPLVEFHSNGTDMLIDDVIIDGSGVQINGTWTNKVQMEDVVIRNVRLTGMQGGPADNSRFERITFSNTAYGCVNTGGGADCTGIHAWYLGSGIETDNLIIRDITFEDSCETAWSGGACTCNIWAMRGGTNATIERITVDATDTGERRTYPCRVAFNQNGGSAEADGLIDSVIRNATWINVDNVIICGSQRLVYENNTYVANSSAAWVSARTPTALDLANRAECAGGGADSIGDQPTVRNNTAYISVPAVAEMRCYQLRMTEGSNSKFYNNACVLVDPDNTNSSCYDVNDDPLQVLMDHNHCWRVNGNGSYARASGNKTLAAMRTYLGGCPGTGNECSSLEADPLFVSSPSNLQLQATSPLRNAGSTPEGASADHVGTVRPQEAATDIGAYEFLSGAPPPEFRLRSPMLISEEW